MNAPVNALSDGSVVRLTQTVKKGGCAAKVAAAELRQILAGVRFPPRPAALVVDGRHFDDAAVYRISADVAIVQTLDFFTPIVDSPFDFGRVAAANAISDVYAMGARPTMALAILAYPVADFSRELVADVLNGGCSVLALAGAALAGGHSIDDDSLKFGLSVTGEVHPDRVWTNAGALPGDVLLLTKPLGTGALSAALKRGEIGEAEMRPAIESMATLNDAASLLADDAMIGAVRAATDVTGFGLAGHATQMARASGARLRMRLADVPRLPLAIELLSRGFVTKAHRTNKDYVTAELRGGDALAAAERLLLFDPQTSGGLLLAVDPARADEVERRLRARFAATARIGSVEAADEAADEAASESHVGPRGGRLLVE